MSESGTTGTTTGTTGTTGEIDVAQPAPSTATLQTLHDDNANRIGTLEDRVAEMAGKLEDFASRGAAIAETGAFGAPAAAAGGVVQEIVDFLHWMFPAGAAGVGGTPPAGAKPTPGVPSWAQQGPQEGAQDEAGRAAPVGANRAAP